MSKYFIDHSKLVIHRTAFITDVCKHHKILHKYLEESNDDTQVENLLTQDGYYPCPYCFEHFPLLKDMRDYVSYKQSI